MDNHYLLIIETPEGNLSRGMRHRNITGDIRKQVIFFREDSRESLSIEIAIFCSFAGMWC